MEEPRSDFHSNFQVFIRCTVVVSYSDSIVAQLAQGGYVYPPLVRNRNPYTGNEFGVGFKLCSIRLE